MPSVATIAQRATSTACLGLGVWGIWLTAAVWKSRRGEGAFPTKPSGELQGQHPTHQADVNKQHTV